MPFDVERVRTAYPALHEGFVHFDGAAGTLVARSCAEAIAAVTGAAVANRTTAFEPGRRAVQIIEQARQAVADLIGGDPTGVVFGPSATALTYLVARTLAQGGQGGWQPGDEVVVSQLEHDANIRPWMQEAAKTGVTVRWASVDPSTGELSAQQYRDLVNDRTRLVAVTAASNAIGAQPDVAAIARIAHDAGALVYVDGVHATPHVPTDMRALGADFYVTSAYKWSGPHLAACVADPQLWQRLLPDKLIPSPDTVPERFEFGTLSFELLAGLTGAVEHLASLDPSAQAIPDRRTRLQQSMSAAKEYEMAIFGHLVAGLSEIPGVWLCPAPANRCPTVAFRVADLDPAQVARALGDEGICVFAGDLYAVEYFRRMGLSERGGAVRASVYHYTTEADVDRLLDAIKRCG